MYQAKQLIDDLAIRVFKKLIQGYELFKTLIEILDLQTIEA